MVKNKIRGMLDIALKHSHRYYCHHVWEGDMMNIFRYLATSSHHNMAELNIDLSTAVIKKHPELN